MFCVNKGDRHRLHCHISTRSTTNWSVLAISFVLSAVIFLLSSYCTVVADISVANKLKFSYLIGRNDSSGRPNSPLIVRPILFDMFDILNVPINKTEK